MAAKSSKQSKIQQHIKTISFEELNNATISTQSKAGSSPSYSVRSDCFARVNTNLQGGHMLALDATCATLMKSNAKMLAKVTDLEPSS